MIWEMKKHTRLMELCEHQFRILLGNANLFLQQFEELGDWDLRSSIFLKRESQLVEACLVLYRLEEASCGAILADTALGSSRDHMCAFESLCERERSAVVRYARWNTNENRLTCMIGAFTMKLREGLRGTRKALKYMKKDPSPFINNA